MQPIDIIPRAAAILLNVVALLAVPTAQLTAQQGAAPDDPITILSRAHSAHTAIRSAATRGRWLFKGSSRDDTMIVSGRTILEVDTADRGLGAAVRIDLDDGRIYTYRRHHLQLLNPAQKKLLEFDSSQGPERPIAGDFCGYLLPPYGGDSIFIRMIELGNAELIGTEVVEGVPCYMVRGRLPDNEMISQHTRTLFIGMTDYRLHRAREEYQFGGGLQWEDRIFTEIRENVTLSEADLTQSLPEGFESRAIRFPKNSERPVLLAPGAEAPDWTLAGGKGDSITLSKLRGRLVLLDFWYTTCGPCMASMPGIQRLHERFAERGLVVIGMNALESGNPMKTMRQMGITYSLALHAEPAAASYHVTGYPAFFLIGSDGTILHSGSGYAPEVEEELAQAIEKALKKEGK